MEMRTRVKLFYHCFAPTESVMQVLEDDVNKWLANRPTTMIERVWFSFQEQQTGTGFFAAVVYKEYTIEDDTARLPSPIGTILGS